MNQRDAISITQVPQGCQIRTLPPRFLFHVRSGLSLVAAWVVLLVVATLIYAVYRGDLPSFHQLRSVRQDVWLRILLRLCEIAAPFVAIAAIYATFGWWGATPEVVVLGQDGIIRHMLGDSGVDFFQIRREDVIETKAIRGGIQIRSRVSAIQIRLWAERRSDQRRLRSLIEEFISSGHLPSPRQDRIDLL
jgi:hypothetical protein